MSDDTTQRLTAVRTQVIELEAGIILKRGRSILRIVGEEAAEVVLGVLRQLALKDGLPREALLSQFADRDRESVGALLQKLQDRRFIVTRDLAGSDAEHEESTEDIFYWHFGQNADTILRRVGTKSVTVLGVNYVSRRLVEALISGGFKDIHVVDYTLLCNLRMFDDRGHLDTNIWPEAHPTPIAYRRWSDSIDGDVTDCLIATSDFGGLQLMREWNEFAIRRNIPFIPVVLQDLIGYIGPLVLAKETACFECFRARQNSHFKDPVLARATESEAVVGQAVTGYHPAMASVLGDITAIEVEKYFGGWSPTLLAGRIIEVNLLSGSMKARRVLKVPRCVVCTGLGVRSAYAIDNDTFVPINEVGM